MVTGVKGKILIIEDERKISDIVKTYLERDGHDVSVADTGGEGISALKNKPDLVILDLMLPDMSGEDICEAVRDDSDTPILMLTAKSEEEDKVRGLGLGADDYVVKPFSPREVVARVNALLRRTLKKKTLLSFNGGALKIDVDAVEVYVDDRQMELTNTEYRILLVFAERPGNVFSRTQLVNMVQGYDFEGYDRTIDAHIKNLRHKIDPDSRTPRFIKTVYGMGYRFIGQPDED
ncbi:transcriptional regulatory protein SrrA [bacterium BMS3Abin07]|nr:transcriptional regulatory protein SrrA [bacterium BMS3Abin07]GBE31737.1 transcriptional regulatory protein SrrA [bacterium BMS3Bbin05]HDL21164.1 response regulator transcription factor [Nitrospirota bacterium]HDO23371.1 response regulator transcription factor [Nitrospirota bacterium]HDZ87192.1 response regulator transcription factor [Nitrospirota bacterium]